MLPRFEAVPLFYAESSDNCVFWGVSRKLPFYCHSFHYNAGSNLCLLSGDTYNKDDDNSQGLITSTVLSFHEEVCLQKGKIGSFFLPCSICWLTTALWMETKVISSSFWPMRDHIKMSTGIFSSHSTSYAGGAKDCLDHRFRAPQLTTLPNC